MAIVKKSLAYPMFFWGGVTATILGINQGDSDVIIYGIIGAIIFAISTVSWYNKINEGWEEFWISSVIPIILCILTLYFFW